ncbi:MAG: hypothetical protein AAGI37_13435 [Planctomycetota bacterium]
MKKTQALFSLLLIWMPAAASAESLPTFNDTWCTRKASDIVVVETRSAEEASFRVLDSWRGGLAEGSRLAVPGLIGSAKGRMVLFLSRQEDAEQADAWRPAGHDFKTSVVWVEEGRLTSIQQPHSRGPAYATTLHYLASLDDLHKHVQMVLESDRLLQAAEDAGQVEDKAALCSRIINGAYLNKDKAVKILAGCGEPAAAVLRAYISGVPMTHQRAQAIPAFVEAGGRAVLPELAGMLADELAYWKETAPGLEKGWWFDSGGEAWVRHSRVSQMAGVFREHRFGPARETLEQLRDLFRRTPAVEDDDRIGSIADWLDAAIAAVGERD